MTRAERIEVLKEIVQSIDYKICNLGELQKQVITATIAELELLEKVEREGVEKKTIYKFVEEILLDKKLNRLFTYSRERSKGFNEAIDACNAHLASKLVRIEEVIPTNALVLDNSITDCPFWLIDKKRVTQAITNLFKR